MSTKPETPAAAAPAAPAAAPTDAEAAATLSKNQAKNEAKKAAKMAKFLAKQAKQADAAPAADGADVEAAAAEGKKDKKQKKAAAPAAAAAKGAKKEAAAAAPAEPEFVNTTPAGEKKDLSAPMAAAYAPKAVEAAWNAWWEKAGYFKPQTQADGKANPRGTYVIPIPPPNVTGSLHLGHALTVSIQDSLTRWNRMLGKTVLYNPGCDHAGIATQSIVEKRIYKESKTTRHMLGREKFLEKVWEWKQLYGDRIYTQLRRLGTSGDWDRARFTMDPMLSKAVNEAFVRLHQEGIIYRSTRLVNWCSHLNTALSNLEVDNKELKGRTLLSLPGYDRKVEFGVIHYFAYPLPGGEGEIVVATTRIETMLGDTAIAVHPEDKRYQHLVGTKVAHPFIDGHELPIIADTYVDMEFGTGAVKITPAHDPNDYAMGTRHNLQFINILNDDGTMNENAGPFAGTKRFDARYAVLEALKAKGLYRETKDNAMELPVCSRSGDVIEPRLKPQWWVNCKDMAKQAMEAVRSGELEIQPKASEKEWFRWLENIQDWCISRQLWWGHRIPAYYVRLAGGNPADAEESSFWVSGRTEAEATAEARKRFPGQKFTLEQDPDVLDTWFSSGLWPFSIFGWPDKTEDLELFYPTSLLETGWDILFFWVVRMVMLGIKLTGKVPFKRVFCHAMVRDAHGRKMSKSLGNVIDPLDVIEGITLAALNQRLEEGNLDPREIEKAKAGQKADFPKGIPECGTDALRFALCAYTSSGRDINLDILRVEGYRKFCNKLWNATRFALSKLPADYKLPAKWNPAKDASPVEKWILSKLNKAAAEVNANLEAMNFMATTTAMHQFWLYELCDVYLEAAKVLTTDSAKATLYTCLDQGLRLLHPIMPFVTEELWQRLPRQAGQTSSIMLAAYPEFRADWAPFDDAAKQFDSVLDAVRTVRSLQTEYGVPSAAVFVSTPVAATADLFRTATPVMGALIKGLQSVEILDQPGAELPAGTAAATLSDTLAVALMVKGFVDVDAEVAKVEAKRTKVVAAVEALKKKMSIDGYETKIKADVRDANDAKLKSLEAEVALLSASIENFLKLKD
ncbi:valine--tRNA ligase [Blastocladiella emersonii ATCC 22665]|nr:valine--tRNA ligase [Blastocladiella emersonii ATCC 22665]